MQAEEKDVKMIVQRKGGVLGSQLKPTDVFNTSHEELHWSL